MSWGSGGQALGSRPSQPHSGPRAVGAGGATVPVLPNRGGKKQAEKRERSPTPESEEEEDDDDDAYMYDSD